MNRIAVQFLDQGLHRVLFEAMPLPVFVVDQDVSVLEFNNAAARLLGSDKPAMLDRRGGEVWHCLHATESPEGCGHAAACKNCVVRESVQAAAAGRRVTRRWTEMELMLKGAPAKVSVRVSAQPFTFETNPLILLVLEGLND
ncbi:MAG TPA: PAS domain-containing protein [Candidatus Acidoferrum sp.]|nr:PAS domain-containing protein [Candidatus Acidoferrum sp.]